MIGIIDSGQKIVTGGLALHLDAAQLRSYPGSGTTWSDLSGNGRNMTLYNSPAFSTLNGGCIDFDGSNDYAQTTNNGLGTGASRPHTLDMWVNFDVLTSTRWWLAVIGQYDAGAHHWIGQSPTTTQFGVWLGTQLQPNLISTGSWLNIVSTFNGSNLTNYVNMTQLGPVSATEFNFTNQNFTIGLRLGAENYFNGKISMVKLYNRALTAAEVLQNFNALKSRFGL